jgi:hypothetical protein
MLGNLGTHVVVKKGTLYNESQICYEKKAQIDSQLSQSKLLQLVELQDDCEHW